MKRIVLLILFAALLLIFNGCRAGINPTSSSFLTNFSLEDLVKKNRSPSGIVCAEGGRGGAGDSFTIVSPKQSSSNKSSSFSCQVSAASFYEAAFIASLKADVEKEIIRSDATIMNRGSSDPAGFYFEYNEGEIHGRISIDGRKSGGDYYSLEANLDEKSGLRNQ